MNHFYQNIDGWFDYKKFYSERVNAAVSGDKFVEIGAWLGKSTSYLAVEIVNSGKEIFLDVVDTWKGSPSRTNQLDFVNANGGTILSLFQKNMIDGGLVLGKGPREINVVEMDSVMASHNYTNESLAFVYIDGEHTEEAVAADIAAWWSKVKQRGMLAGHDYTPNYWGVIKAVDGFFGSRTKFTSVKGSVWYVNKYFIM